MPDVDAQHKITIPPVLRSIGFKKMILARQSEKVVYAYVDER